MSKRYSVDLEAKQINKFDERWYQIPDGDKIIDVRSVTTFLEAFPKGYAFRQWLKSSSFNADIILEQAGQFGSALHGLIETLLKGGQVNYYEEMDIRLWERLMIWMDFWTEFTSEHEVKWSPEFVEMIVYDLDYKYAGTCDFIPRVDGKITPMDWKSGNYVGEEAEIQISTYAKAIGKKFKCEIEKCLIVWMPEKKPNKKGYRIIEVTDIENNFQDFLHVQQVYLRANKGEKPKYKTYPTEITLNKEV